MQNIIKVIIALIIIIAGTSSLKAETNITYDISPAIQYGIGKTEYILDAAGIDTSGQLIHVKSQLEYPLDIIMTGGTFGMQINPQSKNAWRIEAGAYISITDPNGVMKDHDWSNFWLDRYLGSFRKVSFTESDAKMSAFLLTLEVTRRIWLNDKYDISLLAGLRYQQIEQNIFGFAGWQLDPVGDTLVYFNVPDVNGLYYRVTYLLPHFGLQGKMSVTPDVSITAKAAYSIVHASDRDDHILRTKESKSSITGNGFIGGIDFKYFFPAQKRKPLYLSLSVDFLYVTASGAETQHWYGGEDWIGIDPTTGEDIFVPQGTTQTGIPHTINSMQLRMGLSLGYGF